MSDGSGDDPGAYGSTVMKNYITRAAGTMRHSQEQNMSASSLSFGFVSISPGDIHSVMDIESGGQNITWTREMVLRELGHEHGFNYGVNSLDSKKLRSYILCRFFMEELHIHRLCTLPAHRRRGYAVALLEHALAAARSRGAKKAMLEVAASNAAAVALYIRAGFSTDYVRKKYYPDGDDALVMSRYL
jgi:[ribosomal protein S18]-alanine N-acetyltransferase